VVRNGQLVFRPVVQDYLRRVTYRDGWARIINVGRGKVDVTVDPWINGGHPTLARRGIAAADVLSRIRAGESSKAVAADYGLRVLEVTALLERTNSAYSGWPDVLRRGDELQRRLLGYQGAAPSARAVTKRIGTPVIWADGIGNPSPPGEASPCPGTSTARILTASAVIGRGQ
jgi:uncharacterized protein (DUF433 family)